MFVMMCQEPSHAELEPTEFKLVVKVCTKYCNIYNYGMSQKTFSFYLVIKSKQQLKLVGEHTVSTNLHSEIHVIQGIEHKAEQMFMDLDADSDGFLTQVSYYT